MTKQAEIAWIDSIIKQHKDDTYLGKFLAENRDEIINAIEDDNPIDLAIYDKLDLESLGLAIRLR